MSQYRKVGIGIIQSRRGSPIASGGVSTLADKISSNGYFISGYVLRKCLGNKEEGCRLSSQKMLLTQLIMAVQQIHKWGRGASRRSFSIFSIFQHFSASFSIFHDYDGNDDDDDGDAVW